MSRFEGGTALVTGGGSGIGAALARAAAKRGARVAVADIDLETAQRVAGAITSGGGTAFAYRTDVTDASDLAALVAAVERDLGSPGIVFANAGVAPPGTLGDTKPADFIWAFAVNVTGVFLTIQAFLPGLLRLAGEGRVAHIVTTGSENSLGLPKPGPATAYTATKHAVLGLAEGLRRDLKETNVGVTIFCPGLVATNLADSRRNRPTALGGPHRLSTERLAQIDEMMRQHGQNPDNTAWLACEGVERGEFMVITDPEIRVLAERRHAEVDAALAAIDERRKDVPS